MGEWEASGVQAHVWLRRGVCATPGRGVGNGHLRAKSRGRVDKAAAARLDC